MAASKRGNPTLQRDLLSQEIAATGMIQPGAHPEFDKETPLEKIGAWINERFGTKYRPKPLPKDGKKNP